MRDLGAFLPLPAAPVASVGVALLVGWGVSTAAMAQGQQAPDAPQLPSSTLRRAEAVRDQPQGQEPASRSDTALVPTPNPAQLPTPVASSEPAQEHGETAPTPAPSHWTGWTQVQPPSASAPLVSVAPGAFPPAGANAAVRMHFASHGSRGADQAGGSNQSDAVPNGQPWWYAQTVGPIATPSDNEYSYFAYTPPASPLTATGMDPKFWAQDGTGYGQFGWDPYSAGGSTWVGGFD